MLRESKIGTASKNLFYREAGDSLRAPPKPRQSINHDFDHLRKRILGGVLKPEDLDDRYEERLRNPEGTIAKMGDLAWEGDELADNVAEMFTRLGQREGRRLFDQALDRGIDSIDAPPTELAKLFEQLDREPEWLDRDRINRAGAVIQKGGALIPVIEFVFDALVTYYGGAVSRAINATGRMNSKTRLVESNAFLAKMPLPNSLNRFEDGFKRAVRVRIMHAQVRRHFLSKRSPLAATYEDLGMPISNADTMFGVSQFGIMLILFHQRLGGRYTEEELEDAISLWVYIVFIMGGKEEFLPRTLEEQYEQLNYFWACLEEPASNYHRSFDEIAEIVESILGRSPLHAMAGKWIATPFARSLFGDRLCEKLGIPDSKLKSIAWPIAGGLVRTREAYLRVRGSMSKAKSYSDYRQQIALKKIASKSKSADGFLATNYSHHDTATEHEAFSKRKDTVEEFILKLMGI
jgi:hypothetical protein